MRKWYLASLPPLCCCGSRLRLGPASAGSIKCDSWPAGPGGARGRERGRDPSGQGSSSATALLGAVQVFPKDATAKFAVTPSGAVLSSAHPSRPHLPMALFPSPHPPGGTLRRESSQGSAEKRGRGGAQERGAAAGGRGCGRRGPAGAAPRGRRRRREGSPGGKRCRRPRRERRGGKAPVFAPPWSPRLHSCAFPPAPRLAELRSGGGEGIVASEGAGTFCRQHEALRGGEEMPH